MRPITDNKYIDNVRNFLMAAGLNQVFDDCWIYLSENGEYSELLIKTVNGFKLIIFLPNLINKIIIKK